MNECMESYTVYFIICVCVCVCVCVCINASFNDVFNSADYIASNDKMISD
jgi:hypothetical protein